MVLSLGIYFAIISFYLFLWLLIELSRDLRLYDAFLMLIGAVIPNFWLAIYLLY